MEAPFVWRGSLCKEEFYAGKRSRFGSPHYRKVGNKPSIELRRNMASVGGRSCAGCEEMIMKKGIST
jgi:hypothetical protein